MSLALRNGLIIGALMGLYVAWSNWPAGAEVTDTRLVRAAGQIIGSTAVVVLVALMFGRRRK